jgi:putative SOS response-associated peptidase YedK
MPGRFTLTTDGPTLQAMFPQFKVPQDLRPRYNVAPTQPVAVVLNDGRNEIDFLNWGLIPSFSSGAKLTNLLINARSDGVASKPSFRVSFKRRRCLVLADGVYEWVKLPRKKDKIPYWVHMKDRRVFAFAGIWDQWNSMDGSEIKTCAVITIDPNELLAQIHDRMAVILPEEHWEKWLEPGEVDKEELLPLLQTYPAEEMAYWQVSTLVSNARNDAPECVVPVGPEVTPENPAPPAQK